uniref:Putative ovule protein n=1 Tax=Solanum chacoense TaxID=4108 RepID=A0A0V0HUL6_SOLCH
MELGEHLYIGTFLLLHPMWDRFVTQQSSPQTKTTQFVTSPSTRSHHLICQIILHRHYHITGHAAWTTILRLSTQGTPADLWSCCHIGNFSQNAVHYSDTPEPGL